MHAGGGFLGDAVNGVEHLRVFVVDHESQVAAIIQQQIGIPGLAVREDGLLDAPLVFLFGLAFPGEHGDAGGGHGGGRVILGGEDVAG